MIALRRPALRIRRRAWRSRVRCGRAERFLRCERSPLWATGANRGRRCARLPRACRARPAAQALRCGRGPAEWGAGATALVPGCGDRRWGSGRGGCRRRRRRAAAQHGGRHGLHGWLRQRIRVTQLGIRVSRRRRRRRRRRRMAFGTAASIWRSGGSRGRSGRRRPRATSSSCQNEGTGPSPSHHSLEPPPEAPAHRPPAIVAGQFNRRCTRGGHPGR